MADRRAHPGAAPLTELTAACAAPVEQGPARCWRGSSRTLPVSPPRCASRTLERLVVFVDQFEETFTLCTDADERSRFIDALLGAATAPGGPVLVLIAMRADFFGFVHRSWARRRAEASTAPLGPMDEPELRSAIEGPARVAGLKIERGLVDLMLRDVAGEPGSLPLLSHALLRRGSGARTAPSPSPGTASAAACAGRSRARRSRSSSGCPRLSSSWRGRCSSV